MCSNMTMGRGSCWRKATNLNAGEDAVEHVLLPSLRPCLPRPPPFTQQADDVPAAVPAHSAETIMT